MKSSSNAWQKIAFRYLTTLAVLLAATSHAQADGVYDYLPEDALGFVAFHNLDAIDAKVQKLAALFEVPMPAPLALMQLQTGLGEGLDTKGNVLLAILPGDTPTSTPEPMVLLPVADYAKFAESVSGDASGEICRVAIAGEDVLVAKDRGYALLMNVENRETLELLLELEPKPVENLAALDSWFTKNDIVVTIMPAGAEVLIQLGNDGLDQKEKMFEQLANNSQLADSYAGMVAGLSVNRTALDFIGAEVELVSWGLAVDEKLNIRLGKRALLKKGGTLNQAGNVRAGSASVLKGFKDEAFVVAGGGPFPKAWGEGLGTASVNMIRKMKAFYGLEDLEEKDWEEFAQSYKSIMIDFNSTSIAMLPGAEGDPLFSGFYGTVGTSDSAKYLESTEQAFEAYNKIMSQSTRIDMSYEVNETTVADKQAIELSMDVGNMVQDPNVPQLRWMMESMFGEEGKLRYLFVAVDKDTLAASMGSEEKTTSFIQNISKGEMGLANNAEVQVTMKQLAAEAPWKILVSPAGCVQWAERLANEFFVNFTGQTMDFPEFPASPPLGFSMHVVDSRVEADMVWPAETLKALAAYIKICQGL